MSTLMIIALWIFGIISFLGLGTFCGMGYWLRNKSGDSYLGYGIIAAMFAAVGLGAFVVESLLLCIPFVARHWH